MPGFDIWYDNNFATASPQTIGPYNVADSVTAYEGDPAVFTTVEGSQSRLRQLSQADITADYKQGGNIVGFLGIFKYDVFTNADGNVATPTSPVATAGAVTNNYAVPTMAGFEAPDPVTGRVRAQVKTVGNILKGNLWENTTVTENSIDDAVGILISTIGGVKTYFWSTAATIKVGKIVHVDESNPMFNKAATANVQDTTHYPRCPVAVKVFEAYDEGDLGTVYAT